MGNRKLVFVKLLTRERLFSISTSVSLYASMGQKMSENKLSSSYLLLSDPNN